jgi:multidrug efflux system membrane fusion protein
MLDNGVDTTTGTVTLKAQFANPAGHLWPGQFVAVAVELYVQEGAVLVPTTAVMTGQDGEFVFVVTADNKAEVHPVTSGLVVGDRTVIEKGIEVGNRVVTDGQSRLTPNAKVEIAQPGVQPAGQPAGKPAAQPPVKPAVKPAGKISGGAP